MLLHKSKGSHGKIDINGFLSIKPRATTISSRRNINRHKKSIWKVSIIDQFNRLDGLWS